MALSAQTMQALGLSASDQQALQQMEENLQSGANIPWADVLGYTVPGGMPPPAGTATLPYSADAGMFFGGPNAGHTTLKAGEDLGRIFTGATDNPDIGRVLPIQNQGEQTLAGDTAQLNRENAAGWMLDPSSSMYTVPGSGDWGNGTQDVMTLAQMKQGLADWLPDTTLQKLAPDQIATAYGQLKGGQQPVLVKGTGQATLNNQENFAQTFGQAGAYGENAALGGEAAPQYTMDMQKFLTGLVTNAGAGFADPFTNLAKNQTLGNSGFIGNILQQYLQNATGKSVGQLQGQNNLTNVQLAGDLANNAIGQPMSGTTTSFLNTLFGPMGGGPGAANNGGSTSNTQDQNAAQIDPVTGALINALHQSSPVVQQNPLLGANPGWMTSAQGFNRLSPTAKGAYTDLQSLGPNGQTAADFTQQNAASNPANVFGGRAGLASAGAVAGF